MKALGTAFVASALLFGTAAHAVPVTTSVGTYDITTVTGLFVDLQPQLDDQIWWGNQPLAAEFAAELADGLGSLNGTLGPLFSYSASVSNGSNDCAYLFGSMTVSCGFSSATTLTWAVGSQVNVPEPAQLGIVAAGVAGLVALRRRRAR